MFQYFYLAHFLYQYRSTQNQLSYWLNFIGEIKILYMYRQIKPCRYGAQCYYLKQDRCFFYHPAEHKNFNRSAIFKSSQNNRISLKSIIQNFVSDSDDDNDLDTMGFSYLRRQSQAQIQRKRQQQIIRQRQRIQQRRQEQARLNLQRSIRQRLNLIRPGRTSLINLNKEKQQFPWFFQKNNIFNLTQNKPPELQKFNQCPICFEDFLEEIKLKRQSDQSKKKPQVNKQTIDQSPNQWLFYIKEKQVTKSTRKQQVKLIELYCGHIYHKDCVQNWLKKNPKCAVCRKDFRNHQQYSKWDKYYKKRFNCIEQKKLQHLRSSIIPNISINPISQTVPRIAVSNTQQIEIQRRQQISSQNYQNSIDSLWESDEQIQDINLNMFGIDMGDELNKSDFN